MSEFSDFVGDGVADSIDAMGDSFEWNGRTIAGAIDHVAHTITTLKSNFIDANGKPHYPKCGEAIIVTGKTYQITRKGNAEVKAVSGGFIEDPPFVDDPSDPALDLAFDHFVKR